MIIYRNTVLAALLVCLCSTVVSAAGGIGAATNGAYLKECGACHLAYQPEFLPKRSWQKIMGGLDKHFGDTAALDDTTNSEILSYLVKNSADASSSRLAGKVLSSVAHTETPIRISETPYFIRKHREVQPNVFKRKSIGSPANCGACHPMADKGDYNERKIKIPKS